MTAAALAFDVRGLAALTEDELAELVFSADEATQAAAIAEVDRLQREHDARQRRQHGDSAYRDMVHAQYLDAVRECNGKLMNARGQAHERLTDEALWYGPRWLVEPYISEELRNYWLDNPRQTVTNLKAQEAASAAAEREAAQADNRRDERETVLQAVQEDAMDEPVTMPEPATARPVAPMLEIESYATVEKLPTMWWWPGHLARGWLTTFAGPGKVGKGHMECDLIARFTRGWAPPFEGDPGVVVNRPGYVIVVFAEDDPNEQVAWRLDASGADMSRVFDFTYLPDGGPFELPGSVPHLRELVDTLRRFGLAEDEPDNPVMIVIDPFMAVTTGPVSTNHGARRIVAPLMRMVRETGVIGILCHHFTKDGKSLFGSAGLEQVLRCIYTVTFDPSDPAIRVVHLRAGNNTGQTEDARFTIRGPEGAARVVWLSRDEMAARRMSWRDREPAPAAAAAPAAGNVQALLERARSGHAARLAARAARSRR